MVEQYSMFLNEFFNPVTKSWIKELAFYKVDVTQVDLKTDWRFKEVDGKRRGLIYLGEWDVEFPVRGLYNSNNQQKAPK